MELVILSKKTYLIKYPHIISHLYLHLEQARQTKGLLAACKPI